MCFKGHQKQVLNMRPVRKLPPVTERAGGFEGTGWPRGAPARPLDVRGRDRDQRRANGQNLLMGSQGLWDAPGERGPAAVWGTSPPRSPHVVSPRLFIADTHAGYFPLLN